MERKSPDELLGKDLFDVIFEIYIGYITPIDCVNDADDLKQIEVIKDEIITMTGIYADNIADMLVRIGRESFEKYPTHREL